MHQKGQGLPLNTIVIAIIVLVVLVVVVAIFTTNLGRTQLRLTEEEQKAQLEAEALKSSGNVQLNQNCGATASGNKRPTCVAPGSCMGKLVPQPFGANAEEWCVQGLVCCDSS